MNKTRAKLLCHLADIMFIRHEEMCLPNQAFVKSKLHESHLKVIQLFWEGLNQICDDHILSFKYLQKVYAMMKEAYTILSWYPDMKETHQNGSIRMAAVESYLQHISSEIAQ